MHLESFRVTNFRSIDDSGEVQVARITALLGRNESGKSNLLRALHSLNPAEGFKALNPIKDFPRHRRLEECADDTSVVSTRWTLNDEDRRELAEILPRAANLTHVAIGRNYSKFHWVAFEGLPAHSLDEQDVKSRVRKLAPAVRALADGLEAPKKAGLEKAAEAFEQAMTVLADRDKWAQNAVAGTQALRKALATADVELTDKQDQVLNDLEEMAASTANDKDAQAKAKSWAIKKMPIFMYLDEYPELNGHQNIAQYLERKNQGQSSPADRAFDKLCKVAGLDPQKLHELLTKNQPETRNQLANRASAVITSEVRRLWKDRPLKIRFNLDGQHIDTFISDPNATYDVEVNLDERSRGFQWFFAFYVTFAADTRGGQAEDAILLLDEPGLYLHAKSQSDLLRHFEKDFKNQIVYTTHSPFMVPTHNLSSVRTVNISEDKGTTVTNDPTGDARTLFPLQAALGYSIAQSLFVGPNNLVVEGVTDYWLLSSVATHLLDNQKTSLSPELTITPAGGAQKVSYLVALLSSEQLNVLVLLDWEKDAKGTRDDLVKNKLISDQNVVFVTEAFVAPGPKEADIEDLLDPSVYEALVRDSYSTELAGKTLALNASIPRIAKRVEAAFNDLGIQFHKTRPARLFLNRMASDPRTVLTDQAMRRFETLFQAINERFSKHLARGAGVFR